MNTPQLEEKLRNAVDAMTWLLFHPNANVTSPEARSLVERTQRELYAELSKLTEEKRIPPEGA